MRFLTGETVYFLSANSYDIGIYSGTLSSDPIYTAEFNRMYYKIKDVECVSMPEINCYGEYTAWADECFSTEEEIKKYIQEKHDKAVEAYRREIKTVEDFVKFPLSHTLYGEEPNYEAREAYVTRAKELFGFDIPLY